MKNITKNLIFVFALVGVLSAGANFVSAKNVTANPVILPVAPVSGGSLGGGATIASSSGSSSTSSITAPSIVSATATNITQTSATFDGTVNPNGANTMAWFETQTAGPFNLTQGTAGVFTVPTYTLSGLTAGTTYKFRVVASNFIGDTYGSWISFTTVANASNSAASIVSASASNITQTSATFNGSVNPNGLNTMVWFETATGGPFQTQSLGNGTAPVTLTAYNISGLTAGTTYKFRVVASNSAGDTYGNWISFTTSGSSSGCGTIATISSISPTSVTAGSGATAITINGTNFISGLSSALFGGNGKTTTFVSSTQVTMNLLSSDTANAGSTTVIVANGAGCNSNGSTFTVNSTGGGSSNGGGGGTLYQAPIVVTQSATSLSPASATLNGTVNPNNYAATAWFEYSTSNTLAPYSETVHLAEGSANSASTLTQTIHGLTANTTYYFRAVANNSVSTVRGAIYTFQTGKSLNTITTVPATNEDGTSAKLNAIFINQNSASATGHFEYGTSVPLGSTTAYIDLGTSPSMSFSKTIAGLAPKTTYFFRAVATSEGVNYYGNISAFETLGSDVVSSAPVDTGTAAPAVKSDILSISVNTDNVSVGNNVEYLVTFKNNTAKNFENTKISVQLPKEVDFTDSNFGKAGNDNTVVFDAGILVPAQVGSITIKGKINSKAQEGGVLVTTSVMSYNLTGSTTKNDEIAFVTNHVIASTGLEANVLFGANFLPTTLLGWLAMILVILGLVVVSRKIYGDYSLKTAAMDSSDHIDNLPM